MAAIDGVADGTSHARQDRCEPGLPRVGRIVGTPGSGADDGRPSEHDDIGADIEAVLLPT